MREPRLRKVVKALFKDTMKKLEEDRVRTRTPLWRQAISRILSLLGFRRQALLIKIADVFIDGRRAGKVSVEDGPNGLEMKWHQREPKV